MFCYKNNLLIIISIMSYIFGLLQEYTTFSYLTNNQ